VVVVWCCCCVKSEKFQTTGDLPYEADGCGSTLYMDDANILSLLSMPLLGYIVQQQAALLLRESRLWGRRSPRGLLGYQFAWPMSIAVTAMTTEDGRVIKQCLTELLAASAGTGLVSVSVCVCVVPGV